jgi:hypothetical protein
MVEVHVNYYDIAQGVNRYVAWLGLGAYHTGVQVGSREYAFSNAGVQVHTPREAGPGAIFKDSLPFGDVPMADVNAAVAQLRVTFAPGTYDLVRANCNHFSDALVQQLFPGKSLPAWINRSARLGSSLAPKDTLAPAAPAPASKPAAPAPAPAPSERPKVTDAQKSLLDKLKREKGGAARGT